MMDYNFQLHFQLPDSERDPEAWLDALFEAGGGDALPGVAVPGQLSLDFTRAAADPVAALRSAMADVSAAITGARLISAAPDLLNLSELSGLFSEQLSRITRQAMRKYASGEVRKVASRFPAPGVSGSTPLWHLNEVLEWMIDNGKIDASRLDQARALAGLASAIRALNVAGEYVHTRARHPCLADQAMNIIDP